MLDLMVPKERDWMMRESEGGGKTSFGVQQEKNLELKLKLGPPGLEEPSALSLGYVPKASKTTKRGFFETVQLKIKGCPLHAATVNAAGGNRNSSQPRSFRIINLQSEKKKPAARSRANREADNLQLLYLKEKDIISCVATVLSNLCGSGEWMPIFNLHNERFKDGHDKSLAVVDANGVSKEDVTAPKRSAEIKSNKHEGTDSATSDSEATVERNFESRRELHTVTPILDVTIFRYCLEDICERTMLLKELVNSYRNEDIANFAEQVSLYAGCSHHRYQILMSKQLIQEGIGVWNSISGNNRCVLWTDAVPEINKRFMKISCSTTRSLSGKDLEVLREIAECGKDLGHESFEKIWYWLYPVAFSLSKDIIHNLWECAKPLWIEGLITEEAEISLKGPKWMQNPGTFVLRFPTSRSWPHPDVGSLVVTYVGSDSTLHHKLLSLDLRSKFCLKRRLRIRTVQYGTAGNINQLYDSVDSETMLLILIHKGDAQMEIKREGINNEVLDDAAPLAWEAPLAACAAANSVGMREALRRPIANSVGRRGGDFKEIDCNNAGTIWRYSRAKYIMQCLAIVGHANLATI